MFILRNWLNRILLRIILCCLIILLLIVAVKPIKKELHIRMPDESKTLSPDSLLAMAEKVLSIPVDRAVSGTFILGCGSRL